MLEDAVPPAFVVREVGEDDLGLGRGSAITGCEQRVSRLFEHLGARGLGVIDRLAQAEEQRRALGIVGRPEIEGRPEEACSGREGVKAQSPVAGVPEREASRIDERPRVATGGRVSS